MNDKVFVFCPTFQVNGVDAVRRETLESIRAMNGNFEFLLGKFNPYSVGHMNILNQYTTARKLFLASDCSHLMTIEHDMIVPQDAILRLMNLPGNIGYGLYLFRHGAHVVNAYRYEGDYNVGSSLTFFPDEYNKAVDVGVVRVSGAGMGCLLIERVVMENIEFHGREGTESQIPDIEFATDALRAGYKSYCDFDCVCGHIEPNGSVLYPGKEAKAMTNCKVLISVVVNANGETKALREGEDVFVPQELANELARAGYVRIIEERIPTPRKTKTRRTSTKSVDSTTAED